MSDFKPTKEQLQILEQLKEVTEPYYVYTDQMIAIAMWIDAEFEHKSKANGENKQQETALHLRGGSGCLLPTKSQLKQVIEADYKQQYGTNYDESSLENAKQGGLIITNWILNNR